MRLVPVSKTALNVLENLYSFAPIFIAPVVDCQYMKSSGFMSSQVSPAAGSLSMLVSEPPRWMKD